jgi:hypothetical protein
MVPSYPGCPDVDVVMSLMSMVIGTGSASAAPSGCRLTARRDQPGDVTPVSMMQAAHVSDLCAPQALITAWHRARARASTLR